MADPSLEEPCKHVSSGRVRLVASSEDITLPPGTETRTETREGQLAGYFEAAQWTADGTTILTSSSSNVISGYVLPEDLLESRAEPVALSPQSSIPLGEPTNVLASAPYFNLAEPYTNQLLVSSRDHPIQLYYLFPPTSDGTPASHSPVCSYPLIKARSETFLTATSLLWPAPGSHFIAGCKNFLAKFDASRTGEEPVLRIKTIPSERHLSKGNGVGMRGTVSSLSSQVSDHDYGGVVAAGTWTRWVGLYDFAQAGECVAAWGIGSAAEETANGGGVGIGGDGIMQTRWSPCGRYLLVSERRSTGILVYDVRVTGQLLGWLEGREALGNQRISCDVFPSQQDSSFEVWSGSTSGTVSVWEGVGLTAGAQQPSWDWQAHGSTVGSTCLHQTGTVIATCSGSWEFPSGPDSHSNTSTPPGTESGQEAGHGSMDWMRRKTKESTIKIWNLEATGDDDELPAIDDRQ